MVQKSKQVEIKNTVCGHPDAKQRLIMVHDALLLGQGYTTARDYASGNHVCWLANKS